MNVFELAAKISLDSSEYESKLKAAGGKMKSVGDKLSSVGATLTKRVTAPIVALGGLSIKAFNEVQNGLNIVTAKTGASGEALEAMHQSVKNLSTEIPASFDEIGTAVGEVNTRFNITGQELEDLSGQFVKFAKVNGTDVNSSIDTVQKALANFGLDASHAESLLDRMTKTGQETGVSMETLMNGLVQNGAAFQELGLSIDQSVALMGKLDKSGANSEAVMQGLRRALKNAAKEGVPLDQALSDLQTTILNGKDGMDGLTAAYELFGRSGDQIYGAVKNGTLNFEELGAAAGDAAGTLDSTFEATLTPAEKFRTTLNALKNTGYEFGNTMFGMLQPAIERVSKKIQELSKKWQSMDKGTKESIIKFAGLAAAIGPVLVGTGKLISSVGTITKAFGGLFKLIATNPMAALAAAAAALGVALYGAHKASQKALESQYALNEEQQASIDSINKVTEAYEQANQARIEATETAKADAEYSHSLADEYNTLIDSNGKIKEGYEARAEFIKGQLAESLGVEKSKIEELIGANGQLDASIHELIETKKAEAILDANKDTYAEAIKARQTAVENLGPALQTLSEKESQYTDAQQKANDAQKRLDQARERGTRNLGSYKTAVNNANDTLAAAKKAYEGAKEDVDGYTDTLAKAGDEIANFEGLSQALASKDMEAIQQYTAAFTEGIKTRANATQQELKEQASMAEQYYNLIKTAHQEGQAGITQEMVDAAKKRMDTAKQEAGDVSNSAKQEKDAVANNAREGSNSASNSFSTMGSKIASYMASAASTVSTESSKIKGHFPINLGNLFTGTIPSVMANITANAVDVVASWKKFAKAQNQPYVFTKPTFFDTDKIAGEAGDEVLYGRNALMRDISQAAGGATAKQYNAIINRMDRLLEAVEEGQVISVDRRDFARLVNEVV